MKLEEVKQSILEDTVVTYEVKQQLIEYSESTYEHSYSHVTFSDLLINVWCRISTHKDSIEIKKKLNTEMQDISCKCLTGRLSGLVNSLNGYYDDIKIKINDNQQIENIVSITIEKLEDNGEFTVEKELLRRDCKRNIIDRLIGNTPSNLHAHICGKNYTICYTTTLDLRYENLECIPDEVFLLTNLTKLIVSHNKLAILPSDISKLTKLKYLDISHNKVRELHDNISNLTKLRHLDISYNKLTKLPSSIDQLAKNLTNFSLVCNWIKNNEISQYVKETFCFDRESEVPVDELHYWRKVFDGNDMLAYIVLTAKDKLEDEDEFTIEFWKSTVEKELLRRGFERDDIDDCLEYVR